MKKKIILMLMLTITLNMSATSKDTLNAVTMVSYEQGWLDVEGTLALKNNTNEEIHNVNYRITYLDMKGNELDYKDYSSEIEISPGKTKKVNIPAYEYNRSYSYYLSEAKPSAHHKFKINFELTNYNVPQGALDDEESADDIMQSIDNGNSDPSMWLGFILCLFVIGFYIGMYVLVAVMANKRRRNAASWVLVSLFATPLLAIIILLCLGRVYDPYEDKD